MKRFLFYSMSRFPTLRQQTCSEENGVQSSSCTWPSQCRENRNGCYPKCIIHPVASRHSCNTVNGDGSFERAAGEQQCRGCGACARVPVPGSGSSSCARWERCPKNDVGSLAGACRDPSGFGEVKADLAAT